jgi:hypothetical protein
MISESTTYSDLGYPKSVTKKFCTHFWVNKSLSMMWAFYAYIWFYLLKTPIGNRSKKVVLVGKVAAFSKGTFLAALLSGQFYGSSHQRQSLQIAAIESVARHEFNFYCNDKMGL